MVRRDDVCIRGGCSKWPGFVGGCGVLCLEYLDVDRMREGVRFIDARFLGGCQIMLLHLYIQHPHVSSRHA